eukprot:gene12957-3720_t
MGQFESKQHGFEGIVSHIYGTIYGQCIGDAIGLLTEFMIKAEAKKYYKQHIKNGLEYKLKVPDLHRERWQTGDWTDDSDQMLCILQSLLDMNGKIDVLDVGKKLHGWIQHGIPELEKRCMGLGRSTGTVLRHPEYLSDPHKAAYVVWDSSQRNIAPNGAVMRTSILGIHEFMSLEKVKENTVNVCKCSHADPRCIASCVAVTTAISTMLRREDQFILANGDFDISAITQFAYENAVTYIENEDQKRELEAAMFAKRISSLELSEYGKIGYTLKTLGAGFWALRQNDFEKALTTIVMEAGDADTNGAVAGALLGCKLSINGIPSRWINDLKNKTYLNQKIHSSSCLREAFKHDFFSNADGPKC